MFFLMFFVDSGGVGCFCERSKVLGDIFVDSGVPFDFFGTF